MLATHEWGVGTRDDGTVRWKYLLEDVHDRNVYAQRGRWLPTHRTPYLEEHSEYPQLATWMVAVPYLFIDHHLQPGVHPDVRALKADFGPYGDAFHVMMGMVLLALVAVTALQLRALDSSPAWALLLFLPGTLYFGFNRYDAAPAALVGLALWLQLRGRPKGAAVLLGLGAMMKWYPILLLPLFASYNVHSARAAARAEGRSPPPLPGALRDGAIVPGLLAGAVCVAILGITWLWDGGGWEAVAYVYKHHAGRGPNPSSLVTALVDSDRWAWFEPQLRNRIASFFKLIAFGSSILVALFPVRSREALLTGALTVVLGFVAFQVVFSPQWIVWISPLAILLAARRTSFLILAVALELLIYLQAPVFYYEGLRPPLTNSDAFFAVCDTRIWVLIAFWAWSLGSFLRTVMPGSTEAAPADAAA